MRRHLFVVINYLFTLGNGFRMVFVDGPGPVTDGQRAVMPKIPGVDVAMLPCFNFDAGIPPLRRAGQGVHAGDGIPGPPRLVRHHGLGLERSAGVRDPACLAPETRTLDVLYLTPVCFNTTTKDMVIGW